MTGNHRVKMPVKHNKETWVNRLKAERKFGAEVKNKIKPFHPFEKAIIMGWITIYITGKTDFREEVRKKLEGSNVNFMPGYTGATSDMDTHDLYWLDENADLRNFKNAIGSKLIWKFRLNFFTTLEAFIESQKNKKNSEFTMEESDLLARMQASEHR